MSCASVIAPGVVAVPGRGLQLRRPREHALERGARERLLARAAGGSARGPVIAQMPPKQMETWRSIDSSIGRGIGNARTSAIIGSPSNATPPTRR